MTKKMTPEQVVRIHEEERRSSRMVEALPGWDHLIERSSGTYMPVTQYMLDHDLTYDVRKMLGDSEKTGLVHENQLHPIPHSYLQMKERVIEEQFKAETQSNPNAPITSISVFPLPFIHCDVSSLDPVAVALTMREVCETVEKGLLGVQQLQKKIPGLFNVAQKLDGFSNDPYVRLRNGIHQLESMLHNGPYGVVYPEDHGKSSMLKTAIPERIKELGVDHVIASPHLVRDRMILFSATKDTLRLVVGLKLIVTPWADKYKVLCCLVPQLRQDVYGNYAVIDLG